jgi:hypothetical protein
MQLKGAVFWVAESSATYDVNSLKGTGFPDMPASVAMSGDEYLASVPEPATIGLSGLGALSLLRRKK